jgi:6-phosphogluconolactonase
METDQAMNIIEYPDRDLLAMGLANALAGALKNALIGRDHVSFAVPGGTSPGPVFDTLSAVDLDWGRVHVMLTDERWVPETHERSNTALIKRRLLTDRASEAVYVPLYRDVPEPDEVLDGVQSSIDAETPISVLLLGMGADMHTASLFPGGDRLQDALRGDAPSVLPMRVDGQPDVRISLTAPVLHSALDKHLLIFGADKREALEKAQSLPPEEAPISTVLSGMTVHWAE